MLNETNLGMESESGTADQALPPDYSADWSEFPRYFGSPPSSPFHGFQDDEQIPGRLVIKTVEVDGEEVFESMEREKK